MTGRSSLSPLPSIATTEKLPRRVQLVANGIAGHGSVPRLDNAVAHLGAALQSGLVGAPMRLNDTTRAYFEKTGVHRSASSRGTPSRKSAFVNSAVTGNGNARVHSHSAAAGPKTCYTPAMLPAGYTCLAEVEPLMIEIQLSADGLWTMKLLDRRGGFKVVMPPSEFGLPAAKEKALVSAGHYMRKYGGDGSWNSPGPVDWREFTPREVIWET